MMVPQFNGNSTINHLLRQQKKCQSFALLAWCKGKPPMTVGFNSRWTSRHNAENRMSHRMLKNDMRWQYNTYTLVLVWRRSLSYLTSCSIQLRGWAISFASPLASDGRPFRIFPKVTGHSTTPNRRHM